MSHIGDCALGLTDNVRCSSYSKCLFEMGSSLNELVNVFAGANLLLNGTWLRNDVFVNHLKPLETSYDMKFQMISRDLQRRHISYLGSRV